MINHSKKTVFVYVCLFLLALVSHFSLSAQALTGTKTVCATGCDYPTLSTAVNALNTSGVGTGGVTFNIAAGHTETLTGSLVVRVSGSAANPIVFQKNGSGANPLITAFTGTSLASSVDSIDIIWAFEGSDYITIDGINLTESASNTTATTFMEAGIGFYKRSGTDGANNNTIRNCTVTLNRNNVTTATGPRVNASGSVGIEFVNATRTAVSTIITVTAASGSNSFNRIYSNTIQNCNFGISLAGFAAPSPYILADLNNDIGGTNSSTGNSILNFGGGVGAATQCGAMYIHNQWNYNISNNIVNNNTGTGVNHPVTNRGIWLFASSVGSSGDIKKNTITISAGTGTGNINWCLDFEAAQSGANGNTINIDSNQFLNCNVTAASTVAFTAIWLNTAATNVNVRNNYIYGWSYAGTGTTQAILSQLACGNLNISGNIIDSLVLTGTAATGTHYSIGVTSAPSTSVNINNNTLTRTILNTSGTGTKALYPIYYTGSTPIINMIGNTVNDLTRNGTTGGTTIGIYQAGGTNGTSTTTVRRNTVSNMSISGTGTTSTMYGIQVSTGTIICDSNTVFNLSCIKTTGSSALYGIYDISSPNNEIYNNNLIYNLTHSGTGILYGLYTFTTTGTRTVANNTIHTLTAAGTTIAGINQASSSPNLFRNKIYNIQSNSTGSPVVSGILMGTLGTSGIANVYNNLIADLKAPAASISGATAPAIRAINITTTTTTSNLLVSHNTVLINASSTGTNFGTAGLFVTTSATATTGSLTARNNIIVNNSTPAGTGLTVAYHRSSNALNNYNNASNNNLFYAGTPGTANLIYYDGTNSDQTIGAYATRVTPRDTNSISEMPNFLSTAPANSSFLKIDPTIVTGIEANGLLIPGINTDFEGTIRAGNQGYTGTSGLPDLGAFEGNYLGSPANQMVFDSSNTAQITGILPLGSINNRILRVAVSTRKGYNGLIANSFKLNTAGSTSAANILNAKIFFTGTDSVFNNSTLFGTTNTPSGTFYVNGSQRLATGNNYFWLTYDISGAATPGNFLDAQLDSIVLNGVNNAPIDGNPAGNRQIQAPLSGNYNVGTGQIYTTITSAITDLNLLGVSGPVTFTLKDALYNATSGETFPIVLGAYRNASTTNTVKIMPDLSLASVIENTGSSATIHLNGASHYIIDGRQGGTGGFVSGNNLIIRNGSLTAPAISFINDADSNNILYTDLRAANTTALGTANAGVVSFGTTTGANGNDFNTIKFCDIRDDAAGFPVAGISSIGSATTLQTNNDNNIIDSCNIYNYFNAAVASTAVYIGANNNQWTINGNRFYQTATRTFTSAITHRVLWVTPNTANLTSASGFNITNNFIGGNSAAGTGNYTLDGSVAYLFNPMDISVGLGTPTSVQGNTITNIDETCANTGSNSFCAINLANGNVNVGTITGNLIGSRTVRGAIKFTATSTTTGGAMGIRTGGGTGNTFNIANNIISGYELHGTTATTTPEFFGINVFNGTNINVYNNMIGDTTLTSSINVIATSASSTTAQRVSGIFNNPSSGTPNHQIYNNTIANITNNYSATGSTAATTRGILVNPTINGTYSVTNNEIKNIYTASQTTGSGMNAALSGITVSTTVGTVSVTNNRIHSLHLTGAATSAAVQNTGIFFSTTTTENMVARNFIHTQMIWANNPAAIVTGIDVAAGNTRIINNMVRMGIDTNGNAMTTAATFRGITKNSGNSTIYFNTVYVGGTGVNTDFVRTYAFQRTGSGTDDVTNNIFVNVRGSSTPTAGHFAVALNNNSTLTMNYNLLRADSIGMYNNITYLTMSNWKAGSGVDASSINGLAGLLNPTGNVSSVSLKINAANPTPIEAIGTPVSGTGTDIDFDGDIRNNLTPVDMGADAGNFIAQDIAAPAITYTQLLNDTITGNRTFNATITDASGIYVASPTLRPRVYFKKINSGTWSSTQGNRISGTASNGVWQFTINASTMGGLTGSDSVQYFVIAQDSTIANNIGSLPGGVEATDVNTISIYPNPYVYRVLPIITGNYTVGTGGNFTTLTGNDGFFNFINSSVVGSHITATIISDIEEPATVGLNQFSEAGNGGFRIRIVPSSSNLFSITGSVTTASSAVIRFNGCDRVTIDGSFAGSGRYLRFMNRTLNAATLNLLNDATKDTVANCFIEGVNNTIGMLNFQAPASGGSGNDSNVIYNVVFKDTLGATITLASGLNKPNTGVFSQTFLANVGNDFNQVIGCEFNNVRYNAINLSTTSGDYWTLYDNKIYSSNDSNFVNITWIQVNGGGGHIIRKNSFGGSAPDRSGAPQLLRGTGQNHMIFVSTASPLTLTIDSNRIGNVVTQSSASSFYGIRLGAKSIVRFNTLGGAINPWDTLNLANVCYGILAGTSELIISNNLVGNIRGTSASAILSGIYGSSGSYTIRENTVRDIYQPFTGTFTAASGPVGIYALPNAGESDTIDRNTVYNIVAEGAGLYAKGIQFGTSANNVISVTRNRIYNIISSNASSLSSVAGIMVTLSGINTIANNQISLGQGTQKRVYAIYNNSTTPSVNKVYHNTILVNGNSDAFSYGIFNGSTGNVEAANNFIYNSRRDTVGTLKHYAIGSSTVTPTAANLNYNFFGVNDTTAIAELIGTPQGWAAIRSLYTTTYNTNWVENTNQIPASGLFTDTLNSNLHPIVSSPSAWYLNGKAKRLNGVTGDFNSLSGARASSISNGATDIGATEFEPTSAPPSAFAIGNIVAGDSTQYFVAGRLVAKLVWGSAGSLPSAVDVKYYSGRNPANTISGSTFMNAYWNISPTGGSGYDFNLTLMQDSAVLGTVANTSNLAISRYELTGTNWSRFNPTVVNNVTGFMSGSSINRLGILTATDLSNNPLPVVFNTFEATASGQHVVLNWETASETNNRGFFVERSSDGLSFTDITFVEGKGNAQLVNHYIHTDENAFNQSAKLYYRLRQVDMNDVYTYSAIKVVSKPQSSLGISLLPNPSNGAAQVLLQNANGNVTIAVRDIQGKLLIEQTGLVNTQTQTMNLEGVESLKAGIYFVTISTVGQTQTIKFLKN